MRIETKTDQYIMRQLRSNIWTDCPIDCKILRYCRSVKFTAEGPRHGVAPSPSPPPPPPPWIWGSPPPRLSLCSGEDCLKEHEPLFHAAAGASVRLLGGAPNLERCGETECDLWRCPCLTSESLSFDISCFKCACPSSNCWIFFTSSSVGGVPIATTITITIAITNTNTRYCYRPLQICVFYPLTTSNRNNNNIHLPFL